MYFLRFIIYNKVMDEKIFDRVEKKYLITKDQYNKVVESVKKKMKKDGYYKSEVFNIYFDTKNYDLIIQSIDHPIFKEKLRARSYGGYDKVFLEIKTKLMGEDNNVGYKRRVLITKKDFKELLSNKKTNVLKLAQQKVEEKTDLQIAKEVDYMLDYFKLEPKILVYYNRESYKGEDDLRITFDTNLSYREDDFIFAEKPRDKKYFKSRDKNIIMEVKAQGFLPLWFTKLLSQEQIFPQQFSKIGKIYEVLRKEQNV